MPLREDLLAPIAGDNPSGANLYYDKVFDQIKEARIEDEETGSVGAWERTAKRADHATVIKLAGEALATRSKDLRLAGWLIEAHLRREGITLLAPGLELLLRLQQLFWDTLHPEKEEDGNIDLRISAIEGATARLATHLRNAPITRGGHSAFQYAESRRVGYEEAADTSDKQEARRDAISHGKLAPEDFDASFASTKKLFYVDTEASLANAAALLDEMSQFHEDAYGDDYPNLNKITTAVHEVKQAVSSLLHEKRKTEPDAVAVIAEPEAEPEPEPEPEAQIEEEVTSTSVVALPASVTAAAKPARFAGVPGNAAEAGAAVLAGAMYLQDEDTGSPAAYLVCAGLRFGETRRAGSAPSFDFAVAPRTETRQTMRRLASEASWSELRNLCLQTLIEPCARVWLDLHRYIWRAAFESGAPLIAIAVVSTVRGLLVDLPEVRGWMLDDDTPAANAETQAWIDAEVLPASLKIEESTAPIPEPDLLPPVQTLPNGNTAADVVTPDVYETAAAMLKRGRPREAITLLVRDAELQPSGRSRFQRRVQVAQLCLAADQDPVAYPILMELAQEIERRNLDTWESGEMLAHPLSLLLTCLDRRQGPAEHKEAVFERLCRLDPQAAMESRL